VRLLQTRARLAAAGLAIAAATIIALAVLVLVDLERQAELNAEVVVAQAVKDHLYALRAALQELRSVARLGARTGDAQAFRTIERRALDVEAELREVGAHARYVVAGANELAQAAQLLVVHARSVAPVRRAQGAASVNALSQQADRLATEAVAALDRALAAQTARIADRTLTQVALAERLRSYVAWLLAGSIAVLVGLFATYRRAQVREREAQQRIERLAHFDGITGLPNRALLSDRLAQEVARARRNASAFALLAVDLDGFKAVNDTWGHAAGDRVLAEVAERLRACMRASDTIGRIGGDEFLAILPEATDAGAVAVADKLREALREPYAVPGGTARLGASVGVSVFPDHGRDADALLSAADQALYRAKREGRDRTQLADAPPQHVGAGREVAG
jgi:diguanylate cyclase (GGDEF)-like protein